MIFYFVRHGEPIYNPDSLTPRGEEQAKALAKRFTRYGLDEIYASTSNRALQTAIPTCDVLHKTPVLCEWAHESLAWQNFTVPQPDGRRIWGFSDRETVQKFTDGEVLALGKRWYTHKLFENTNFEKGVREIDAATDAFLQTLGYRHVREKNGYVCERKNPRRIALFAHQGFGLAFLSSLLDIPYPLFASRFDLSHSSMTVIRFDDEQDFVYPKILQLANDSHLYKENILTAYNNEIDV